MSRSWGASIVIVAWSLLYAPLLQAADLDALVRGNTEFAFDLYRHVEEDKAGENTFLSPASISTALAMTYAGAKGETGRRMAETLRFTLPQDRLHPAFSSLLSGLKGGKDYELAVANALWGQKGKRFEPDFLKVTNDFYGGGFRELDFASAPDPCRETINRWVEEKTRQKIKDLLHPPDITSLTRLVLTNAIYFKGVWMAQFDPKQTREAPFSLDSGKMVPVPMMSQKGRFNFLEEQLFDLLELPYAGEALSMLVLLPKEGADPAKVEQVLTAENLQKWQSSMRKEEVRVFLPKFKLTSRFVLNDPLTGMGMEDAFSVQRADFSGMTGRKDLCISKVIHQAFVDVNEEGTEAAAATAVVMAAKSIPMERVFRADHPFLFAILDKNSGSVLFMGTLRIPQEG